MPVFELNLLELTLEESDSVVVLGLPLLGDLLLMDHHCVGLLFVGFVPLLRFEKDVLQMSYFDVCFVV